MHGSTQQITVNSFPSGATVLVDGGMRFRTPAVFELSRKDSHRVEISLDGYESEIVDIRQVSNDMVFGNIVAGGLIGLAVDNSSGSSYRLEPEVIKVNLRPLAAETQKAPAMTDAKESGTTKPHTVAP
jgi:hypothetical protein